MKRVPQVWPASESSNRGDASPDASLDASLHLSTPTFPRNLAVYCCYVAATDSLCWVLSSAVCAARGGLCRPVAWPLLRLVVEPAGASALRHTCPANFAASAASSPSVVGSISPYFALDFSRHLSVNGKRQPARRGWYVQTNG